MKLRFANYLMIAIFILASAVQYNDVHALRWMLVYGAAGLLCILFAMNKLHWATASALAGVSGIWALFKIPHLTVGGFRHMLDEVQMNQAGVEAAREFLGLLIIAGWMIALAVSVYRKRQEM